MSDDREIVIADISVPGPFECRIDAQHRIHGHIVHVSMNNDDGFYLFNIHDQANSDAV